MFHIFYLNNFILKVKGPFLQRISAPAFNKHFHEHVSTRSILLITHSKIPSLISKINPRYFYDNFEVKQPTLRLSRPSIYRRADGENKTKVVSQFPDMVLRGEQDKKNSSHSI